MICNYAISMLLFFIEIKPFNNGINNLLVYCGVKLAFQVTFINYLDLVCSMIILYA